MKKIVGILTGMILYTQAFGQTTGKIFDETTKQALVGAKVETSDAQSVVTDANGSFTITCKDNIELTIYKVGYGVRKYQVANCGEALSIGMTDRFQEFNEIQITERSTKNKSLLEQPVSIVRINEGEIQRGNGLFMADAINTNTPGVNMQSRTTSGGQQFNIRGYGNGSRGTRGISSNFDGQGTKVYLNGIPVTNAEGVTIMDDIDFGSIANVEILKGPSGTIFGSAIAGVVNFQTRKAAPGETSISQNTMLGSYGLLRSTTQVAIGTQKTSFLINYGHQQMEGFMPHTATKKDFVNMIGDFTISPRQKVTTYFGYSNGYDQRNGELTIEQYDTLDYSGNPAYVNNDAHSAAQTLRAGVGHTYNLAKWVKNTTSIFGVSQRIDNSSAGGWNDVNNLSFGLRSTFDMAFKFGEKITLNGITGIEWQKTSTLANGYKMKADSTDLSGYNVITSLSSIASTQTASTGIFTQWTLGLPFDIDLTAGIGYNRMDLSYTDRLWGLSNNTPGNTTPKSYATNYSDMFSPTVALNKQIKKTMSVYASFSIGYKAPVSSYFYIPQTGEVNTGLVPEKGTQIEIGTKGSVFKNRLFYTVALFNTKFTDKMTTVTVQNPQNTATLYAYMVNAGTVNNSGVEVLLKFDAIKADDKFVTALRPFANFTYAHYKYEDFRYETVGKSSGGTDSTFVNDYSGNTVVGVPPIAVNVGIDVETRIGLYGNVVYNYRDAMYFTSDGLNKAAAYSLLNAKLGYKKQFKHFGLDAFVGANNITSTQYYSMVFVNQLPDAYIPAAREINFFGGINLNYTF